MFIIKPALYFIHNIINKIAFCKRASIFLPV